MRFLLGSISFAFAVGLAACSGSPHDPAPPAPPIIPSNRIEVLLPYPDDGGTVTWDNWTGTFIGDYCASCHNPSAQCTGSGCHNAGDLPDFRQKADVVKLGAMIRCGISVHQDPSWNCGDTGTGIGIGIEAYPLLAPNNPFPTDEQRSIVADWITQGAP